MPYNENQTLSKIFDLISNEEGLKDTSLLLDIEREQELQQRLNEAFAKDKSHTRKLSENEN